MFLTPNSCGRIRDLAWRRCISYSIQGKDKALLNALFNYKLDCAKDEDVKVISERQLENSVFDVIGTEAGKCRYGHPRAFVRQPISASTINSGFFRLSCPHLVKAVDKLEETPIVDHTVTNGIAKVNAMLGNNSKLSQNFDDINRSHSYIRKTLLRDDSNYHLLKNTLDKYTSHSNNNSNSISDVSHVPPPAPTATGASSTCLDQVQTQTNTQFKTNYVDAITPENAAIFDANVTRLLDRYFIYSAI